MAISGNGEYARNVNRLGHLDIPGGGQVVVKGNYAYVGHLSPPNGTSIIDVSNPRNPQLVSRIMLEDPYTHTHKVRVVGDIMYTNYEQDNRYYYRRGEMLKKHARDLTAEIGQPPTDSELAKYMSRNLFTEGKPHKLTEQDVAELRAAQKRGYHNGGFRIYNISDKYNPQLIKHQRTYGWGCHRFDVDERYAYMSTEWEGYQSNIIVIYDVSDPSNPTYVSHWGIPGQHVAGGETPHWLEDNWRVHHGLRQGDTLWVSALWGGMYAVDISDVRAPHTKGHYNYHPPFSEPTHTVLPLPFDVGGRKIAVVGDETQVHRTGQPFAMLWFMDISDIENIRPVSVFTVSQLDSPYARPDSWFGCHQFQEHFTEPVVYSAWFAGGLRIIDISNPSVPTEIGFYVPNPSGGQPHVGTNDVDVGHNGLIYTIDRYNGFDVLEMTGRSPPLEPEHRHGSC